MNGGVPDDVGPHQAPGPLRPPQDEVQHLVVLVQVADRLWTADKSTGKGMEARIEEYIRSQQKLGFIYKFNNNFICIALYIAI